MPRLVAVALLASARIASAQAPAPAPAPLAQIKDAQQLAETLAAITNDPAVPVDDPSARPLAQALLLEGVKQLQANAYEQALANFLAAYARVPSPKILIDVAATLRDMGRLADAANTYQRYLLDPATGAARATEVAELLGRLDEQLTVLTVRVSPRGSEVSIDGGPFIPVGSALQARVRPGLHLARIRHGDAGIELTINGFAGETKEVVATVPVPPPAPSATPPPEQVQAWLATGTQYGGDGVGRARRPRTGFAGPEVAPIVPEVTGTEDHTPIVPAPDRRAISSGVLGVVRVDGEGRGLAAGVGLAVAFGHLEADLVYLRSNLHGGFAGVRYRILGGALRPYVAAGMPLFLYDEMDDSGTGTSKRVALGVRAAAGVELELTGHFSVHGDLGYERFFAVEERLFYASYFIPTVGVIGRL